MRNTYEVAINKVFKDEGGYTNESTDPGGPTNWGITIHDAQTYWKKNATAEDVMAMPKVVAEDIYRRHYTAPIHYDDLPAGVDYAVLDYGINSGISRSSRLLQRLVNVTQDGVIGPETLDAVAKVDPISLIRSIYTERLAFLQTLHTWPVYKKGWIRRCETGRDLAISLAQMYAPKVEVKTWWQKIIDKLIQILKGNK